jgi:hypothetical protein
MPPTPGKAVYQSKLPLWQGATVVQRRAVIPIENDFFLILYAKSRISASAMRAMSRHSGLLADRSAARGGRLSR